MGIPAKQALVKVCMMAALTVFTLLVAPSCGSTKLYVSDEARNWKLETPPDSAQEYYRVLLVGDAGAPRVDGPDPVLTNVRRDLDDAMGKSAVVFLGDNLYCCGMPDSADPSRGSAELALRTILESVRDFTGPIFFIPGNHDWNRSGSGGLEAVRRQEKFIEAYLGRGNTFLPDRGFPGPSEVKLTDDITLIAIDTEWWLTDEPKSFGDDGENEIREPADFLLELQEKVEHEHNKKLLIVGHHPLYSNAEHGGYFPLREHIFPLTQLWDKAYLPLPVIGSIPLLYARYFGASEQDLAHHRYRQLRSALNAIFSQHENLIYASGHEHNLQYFRKGSFVNPQHHVIAGSASRTAPVAPGHGAIFTADAPGYASLHYYDDGSIWLSFWDCERSDQRSRLLFRTRLEEPQLKNPEAVPGDETPIAHYPDYADSTKVIAANPGYRAGAVKRFFLGSHNRDLWAAPVRAPFLDLGRADGGLTPVKRGGGLQTTSIRLAAPDGKQYVLRSLDKDPTRSIPPNLANTVAVDIIRDQVASMNPYGAFVLPRLADAVGIYHTEPRLVYVPDDPRLGVFAPLVSGTLMMLEDLPADDMSDVDRYGGSKDVESASRMYESINEDNDDFVDQHAFVTARLFDMLISDWDRHRDQWRWASFKNEGKGRHFKPIPRDRDWAFNKMNGLFPSLARYVDPKFQDFEKDYGNIKGLTHNGLEQDRRLMSGLARSDFLSAAEHIQDALSDEVITQAVSQLPDTVETLVGAEMVDKLIARRDKLDRAADTYYELLASTVDVVGSDKHERFEVRARDRSTTEVTVYKTTKEGEKRKEIYHRAFLASETDEIRLYGLGGNDTFALESSSPGMTVRAIGGPGVDRFTNDDRAEGAHFRVYDTREGNQFNLAVGRVTRTDDPFMTRYDPLEYQHDFVFPVAFFGSNTDDGIFVGGGARFVKYGFKKVPFASQHIIRANVAAKTRAFNIVYNGRFVRAAGPYDLLLQAEWLSPNNIRNFYGLGNQTTNAENDRAFYQAQLTQIKLSPSLRYTHPLGAIFELAALLRITDVGENDERFVAVPQAGVSPSSFRDQWFTGARLNADFVGVDNAGNPKQGFAFRNSFEANVGIRNATESYGKVLSDLTIYFSPSLSPQLTFAARAGVEHAIGQFPFYDASTLGGKTNLRGYRGTRYSGRTAFYQNLEARLRLFRFSAYLANGDGGILGFVDNGRVWTEQDAPNRVWHQGYGGGLWANVLNIFTVASWVGASKDELTYTLKLGFQY